MSITEETRRDAYYESREGAPTRRREIYQHLKENGEKTAEELMQALGYHDPNNVRPRLTELKEAGLIEACGKKKSASGRSVAIWRVCERRSA